MGAAAGGNDLTIWRCSVAEPSLRQPAEPDGWGNEQAERKFVDSADALAADSATNQVERQGRQHSNIDGNDERVPIEPRAGYGDQLDVAEAEASLMANQNVRFGYRKENQRADRRAQC